MNETTDKRGFYRSAGDLVPGDLLLFERGERIGLVLVKNMMRQSEIYYLVYLDLLMDDGVILKIAVSAGSMYLVLGSYPLE